MTGNDKGNDEEPPMDPITLMLDMKREFKSLKQKNAKEIEALRVENQMMKKKIELGHMPTTDENMGVQPVRQQDTYAHGGGKQFAAKSHNSHGVRRGRGDVVTKASLYGCNH